MLITILTYWCLISSAIADESTSAPTSDVTLYGPRCTSKDATNTISKISGGQEVDPIDRYPYFVGLVGAGELVGVVIEEDNPSCGGALVHKKWVLTASSCFGASHVLIGRNNLCDSTEDYEKIEIEEEVQYGEVAGMPANYLLLKLKEGSAYPPVSFDDGQTALDEGAKVTAMGWGLGIKEGVTDLSDNGAFEFNTKLMEIEVDIMTKDDCVTAYDGYNITSDMTILCTKAGDLAGCIGDKGAPLIVKGASDDADVLVGVNNMEFGCYFQGALPDLYAQVSEVYDWIQSNVDPGPTVEVVIQGDMEVGMDPADIPTDPDELDAMKGTFEEAIKAGSGEDDVEVTDIVAAAKDQRLAGVKVLFKIVKTLECGDNCDEALAAAGDAGSAVTSALADSVNDGSFSAALSEAAEESGLDVLASVTVEAPTFEEIVIAVVEEDDDTSANESDSNWLSALLEFLPFLSGLVNILANFLPFLFDD